MPCTQGVLLTGPFLHRDLLLIYYYISVTAAPIITAPTASATKVLLPTTTEAQRYSFLLYCTCIVPSATQDLPMFSSLQCSVRRMECHNLSYIFLCHNLTILYTDRKKSSRKLKGGQWGGRGLFLRISSKVKQIWYNCSSTCSF